MTAGDDQRARFSPVERRDKSYLPMAYDPVYGLPVHWRRPALDDLEFLQRNLEATRPLARALTVFHEALRLRQTGQTAADLLATAQGEARAAAAAAADLFPQIIDPAGAEGGTLRTRITQLQEAIRRVIAS